MIKTCFLLLSDKISSIGLLQSFIPSFTGHKNQEVAIKSKLENKNPRSLKPVDF